MRRARRVRDLPLTETLWLPCMQEGRFARVKVEAVIRGPLAIHPSTTDDVAPWTVTHVATGFAIWKFFSETDAEEFVQTILPLDWDFKEASAMPRATSIAVALLLRSLRP